MPRLKNAPPRPHLPLTADLAVGLFRVGGPAGAIACLTSSVHTSYRGTRYDGLRSVLI